MLDKSILFEANKVVLHWCPFLQKLGHSFPSCQRPKYDDCLCPQWQCYHWRQCKIHAACSAVRDRLHKSQTCKWSSYPSYRYCASPRSAQEVDAWPGLVRWELFGETERQRQVKWNDDKTVSVFAEIFGERHTISSSQMTFIGHKVDSRFVEQKWQTTALVKWGIHLWYGHYLPYSEKMMTHFKIYWPEFESVIFTGNKFKYGGGATIYKSNYLQSISWDAI